MLPLLMMLPAPCFRSIGCCVFHAEHHAAHQGDHRGVEASSLEAFDAAGLRRAAGVVEQAIDASELFDRQFDQRADLLVDHDIGLAKDAVGAELLGQPLALRHAAPGDHDPGAFRDENLAVFNPMPLVAPVMTATLPSSLPIELSFVMAILFQISLARWFRNPLLLCRETSRKLLNTQITLKS